MARLAVAGEVVGRIALRKGYVTRQQLEECRTLARAETSLSVGQLLLRRRFLGTSQLVSILKNMKPPETPSRWGDTTFFGSLGIDLAGVQDEAFGKYALLEVLGRGGMGVVFRARDTDLDREVALKILRDTGGDDSLIQRFIMEAQAAARLKHPGIVAVHEVGAMDGAYYFTMDYVRGESLENLMVRKALTRRDGLAIFEALARAVHHAHENGVIHRDLKPANVVIDEEQRPRIMDFGLAKLVGHKSRIDETGMMIGTPYYMSPEQVEGEPDEVDPFSDQFALGVMMYEFLTGRLPFIGDSAREVYYVVLSEDPVAPRRLDPTLPRDLEIICLTALEKKKKHRYPTVEALADDLRHFLQGEPIGASPPFFLRTAWKRLRHILRIHS